MTVTEHEVRKEMRAIEQRRRYSAKLKAKELRKQRAERHAFDVHQEAMIRMLKRNSRAS